MDDGGKIDYSLVLGEGRLTEALECSIWYIQYDQFSLEGQPTFCMHLATEITTVNFLRKELFIDVVVLGVFFFVWQAFIRSYDIHSFFPLVVYLQSCMTLLFCYRTYRLQYSL